MKSAERVLPTLPPDFPSKLLDLELELETNCCLDSVTALLNLYQQAIVYFEHFKTEDFHTYQNRLHSILMREEVQEAMKRPETENLSHATIKEKQDFVKKKERENALTPQGTPRSALLPRDSSSLAQNDLKIQEANLDDRLLNRKSRSRPWTPKTPERGKPVFVFEESEGKDESLKEVPEVEESSRKSSMAGLEPDMGERSRKSLLPTFGKRLEDLMNTHCADKAKKLSEIRLKYQLQLLELQQNPTPFLQQVMAQVTLDMETEVKEATADFDQRRKAAIDRVKQEYIVS